MIQIQNAGKAFKGHPALQNLNLNVGKGEILGLLVANGVGKSTTINLLLGFLSPDSGTVRIDGKETSNKAEEVRNIIGHIPENFNLYTYLTGLENLDYFCKPAGFKYTGSELQDILSTCGLQKEEYDKKVSGYSKGIRQKVGIAIAYAKKS
jgi:ABC-2 type transport system ATP-binding protein